ncbi:MAG TPA: ATP-binding cassette domain-containing protein, partial [Actinopolymorphaceae bacterium]
TGMKQRVKLAQAIVHDPTLIFLDEPTNGLDPVGRDEMLGLIRRIGTDFGISVLVTSHLLGELERIADHIIVIDAGRLLRSSTTADFTQATGVLAVEVADPTPDGKGLRRLATVLGEAGHAVAVRGQLLEVPIHGDDTFDLVRDQTARLGLGLVRMQQSRHRIAEVFATGDRGATHEGGTAR